MQSILHPNDASDKIWLQLAHWLRRYSSLKMFMDGRTDAGSTGMLDHPITVVLNVFDTLKNNGLKVYKFMSIQTQEDHISHI